MPVTIDKILGEPLLHTHKVEDIKTSNPPEANKVLYGDGSWQEPPGASGGEANVGENVGTAGVGIYKNKVGVTLNFKKVNAGSNKISITDDTTNNKVDIDIDETKISHSNLTNLNSTNYTHLTESEKTDLTDGGDSSAHYHSSDRDRANHTGTQTASTISDFDEAVDDEVANLIQAGDGISKNYDDTGNTLTITNTDKGSTAVSTHEATYNHSDIHSHSNKTLLDSYTQTEADLSSAVSLKHNRLHSLTSTSDHQPATGTDKGKYLKTNLTSGNPELVSLSTVAETGDYNDLSNKPTIPTSHTQLSDIGTNTHNQIDSHIASTSNPHQVDKTQVGLGNVQNVDTTNASNITSGTLDGDRLPSMSTTKKGGVPPTGTPSGKFLKDDGTWDTPPGGGDNITINGSDVVDADFDDATPTAPSGGVNVKWQKDTSSPANISAYLPVDSSLIDAFRLKPFYYTDFLGPSGATTIEAAYPFDFAVINSGTQAKIVGETNHPGILRISSSTTANSGGYVLTDTTAFLLGGGECFELVFQHRVASGTKTTLRFGFLDSTTYADAVDGAYFEVPAGSLNIVGKTANNSTRSTTSTSYTLTVNTWYRARLVVNSNATRVDFYLYNSSGTQLWTDYLTTNIPTELGRNCGAGVIATNSGTTATLLCYLDWMAVWFEGRALTG